MSFFKNCGNSCKFEKLVLEMGGNVMPNWCMNDLSVIGPKGDVEKFIEDVKVIEDGKELLLSFDKLIPIPEEIKDPNPEILSDAQYFWSRANWGTKWDLCAGEVNFDSFDLEDGTLQANYSFDTAWSPCEAWIKTISPMYPTLTFALEYGEGGMDFQGVLTVTNGEISDEYHESYDPKKWGDEEDEEEEVEEIKPV
jgi:hypothetical protein